MTTENLVRQKCQTNWLEWVEIFCAETGRLIERKVISFNSNPIEDVHQWVTESKARPDADIRFCPIKYRGKVLI